MQKYNKSEGKLEVLTGRQANVLNDHFSRTGKTNLDNFTDEERQNFDSELAEARKADETEQKEAKAAAAKAASAEDSE